MPTFKYIRPFHPKIKQIKEQSSKPSLQITPLVNLRLRACFVLRLAAQLKSRFNALKKKKKSDW
jgi:hypothetical protein